MNNITKQCVCIKSCLKIDKNTMEIFDLIKLDFNDLNRCVVILFVSTLKKDCISIEDHQRSG